MQARRSLCLIAQAPPLHPQRSRCRRRIGAMKKLTPILLAIALFSMIGLAGCAQAPGYYGSYGYPTYGYYYPWLGHERRDFDHGEHFDHHHEGHALSANRSGVPGFYSGAALASGGGFHGGFGGGHFGEGGGRR